jgi:hypothetical protein
MSKNIRIFTAKEAAEESQIRIRILLDKIQEAVARRVEKDPESVNWGDACDLRRIEVDLFHVASYATDLPIDEILTPRITT